MKYIKVKDGLCVCNVKSSVEGAVSVPKDIKWVLDEPVFDVLKRAKIREVKEFYERKINSLTAGYNKYEIESFIDQRAEWKAYTVDDATQTPIVDALAKARGVDREVLLGKIGDNVLYIINLQGKQNAMEDEIKAYSTEEELTLLMSEFTQ